MLRRPQLFSGPEETTPLSTPWQTNGPPESPFVYNSETVFP